MKKLLIVLVVLVLTGCSLNKVNQDEQQGLLDLSANVESNEFELVEDTVEVDDEELNTYKGTMKYEGEAEVNGRLKYPSAFDTPWYFESRNFNSDGFDLSFFVESDTDLNPKLPESIVDGCTYEFEAVVMVKNPMFNYIGYHINTELDDYEILQVSDDYVEICN